MLLSRNRRHKQVADATFNKVEVVDTYSESYADDRPHERRYEHGAYYNRSRIGVEAPARL